jgi:hypothetical protein
VYYNKIFIIIGDALSQGERAIATEVPLSSMAIVERERTSAEIVMYALYLYFLGLSFRNTSRALQPFVERSHVAVWDGYKGLIQNKSTHVKG